MQNRVQNGGSAMIYASTRLLLLSCVPLVRELHDWYTRARELDSLYTLACELEVLYTLARELDSLYTLARELHGLYARVQ